MALFTNSDEVLTRISRDTLERAEQDSLTTLAKVLRQNQIKSQQTKEQPEKVPESTTP